jgi:hypothetical protein
MEEDCRGGQGLSWAVEPRRERERERESMDVCMSDAFPVQNDLKQGNILIALAF